MTNIITITNLSTTYHKKQVLQDINFSIGKGEIVGLVGPNGAGKTTLMKAVLGFIPVKTGEVHFAGCTKKLGALIENPGWYPFLTGLEHLQLFLAADVAKAAVEKVVHRLNMNDFINKKAKDYSLGMKQRLGIALALLNQPELVILDEPMNGLDPQANQDLRRAILAYAEEGTAFLISSHLLTELEKVVERTILLKAGAVVRDLPKGTETSEEFESLLLGYLA